MSSSQDIRHKRLNIQPTHIPSVEDEKDWAREDSVEFPSRSHIRGWVREELLNRWRNFGLQYTHEFGGEATNYDSMKDSVALKAMANNEPKDIVDWNNNIYKGPKTSWARFTSSAIVKDSIDESKVMEGFILVGNGNFHDTYGFDKGDGFNGGGGDAKTLLGYDITGKRHEIDEPDYKYRPSPGITSVESEDIEPGKNFRRTTVSFTVWSHAQLDYMDAYFFQPGMSAIVEWGWNTYPRQALLTLDQETYNTKIPKIWNNLKDEEGGKDGRTLPRPPASQHLREGNGNYGYAMGLIHGFNYSIRDDGGYDCTCQVSCMSEIGHQVMIQTSRKQKADSSRTHDLRTFIKSPLRRLLQGESNTDYANYHRGKRTTSQLINEYSDRNKADRLAGDKTISDKQIEKDAITFCRGRYFSFDPYTSTKPYYAGKNCQEGTYITVGYLLDLFNLFFGRVSEQTGAKIWEVSCFNNRAIAHPNIKSINGDVLLIPNSLAVRWNQKTYHGSSIAVTSSGESSSAAYGMLMKGTEPNAKGAFKETTSSFVNMVKQMLGRESSSMTLEEAIKAVPRDDLHRILSYNATSGYDLQHPAILGKLHKNMKSTVMSGKKVDSLSRAWEESYETVRPFPDYASPDIAGPTLGYSGRIADLFVNLNVIDTAFDENENAESILLAIMKKVSGAAGDIWDFQLVGNDVNTSSNAGLSLIDANFSGIEDVSTQKESAWVFPTHRGDSIVREMSLDVDPKSELSSQIVFGNLDSNSGFYSKQDEDLILKHAINPVKDTYIDKEETKPEVADDVKYIVALSSKGLGEGKLGSHATYDVDNSLKTYDVSYVDKDGKTKVLSGYSESKRQENLVKARNEAKTESSIKTGSSTTKARPTGSSSGIGDVSRKREWQVWIDSRGFNKLGAEQNSGREEWMESHGVKKKIPTRYPSKLRRFLVGKTITLGSDGWTHDHFDDYTSVGANPLILYDRTMYSNDLPEQTYKVIGANMISVAQAKKSEAHKDDGAYNYFYRLRIQEVEGKGLSDSDMERTHIALKKPGGTDYSKLPPDIKQKMKDRGLTLNDIKNQRRTQYNSVVPKNKTSSVIKSSSYMDHQIGKGIRYGTDKDDVEIDVEMVDPDKNRMLENCRLDGDKKNNIMFNQRLDGVELSLKLDGIEGLRIYDVFNCTGVPAKYYERGVFAITGVKHSIAGGDWTTDLECMFFPG